MLNRTRPWAENFARSGLGGHTLRWYGQVLNMAVPQECRELFGMAALLEILVGTRIAAIRFPPATSGA